MYSTTFKYEFTPGAGYNPMCEDDYIIMYSYGEWFVVIEDMLSEDAAAQLIMSREDDFVGAIPVDVLYNDIKLIKAIRLEADHPEYFESAIH